MLHERQHTVPLFFAPSAHSACQLRLNRRAGVEQVDLGSLVGGGHFAAREAGHHGVHQVHALLESQRRQHLLRQHEDLALIDAAELRIRVQVLFIERLQARVDETGDERVLHLLDHICASFARIVNGDGGQQAKDVGGVRPVKEKMKAEDERRLFPVVFTCRLRGPHEDSFALTKPQ